MLILEFLLTADQLTTKIDAYQGLIFGCGGGDLTENGFHLSVILIRLITGGRDVQEEIGPGSVPHMPQHDYTALYKRCRLYVARH